MAAKSAVRMMSTYYKSLDLVAKKRHDEKTSILKVQKAYQILSLSLMSDLKAPVVGPMLVLVIFTST